MVVAEALGEQEEQRGVALIGKAGLYLFSQLHRVGVSRETLTLFNTVACRPPGNKLVGMPYEAACIDHCRPNLDDAIKRARETARLHAKTFVIVTLGRTAFKRVLDLTDRSPILKYDYIGYPFWSEKYSAWVLAADHPAYLMRGNHHLVPTLQFVFRRAMEIANGGCERDRPRYLLDPDPAQFRGWVDEFLQTATPDDDVLSYDIETPMKQGNDEEDVAKEDDDDWTILRCSFAYRPGHAVSVPWRAEYLADIGRLFASNIAKLGWNSDQYDSPRVSRQVPISGDQIDAMLAWHVLNSALPKGLGFVTPFYAQTTAMWKHLSNEQPAFYNAKDADMALQCWLGIKRNLIENDLWKVFDRHIIQLNRCLHYMSSQGVLLDQTKRNEAETRLTTILKDIEKSIDAAIPSQARALKVYKKTPKSTDGLVTTAGTESVKQCPGCRALRVKAVHFKSVGKKRLKAGDPENPCAGLRPVKTTVAATLWAAPLPFRFSVQSLARYQRVMGHQAIFNYKEKRVTYDEKAITKLVKKYPADRLYPLILQQREVQKLRGTYVGVTEDGRLRGGMPTGPDGRIHATITNNPETLRTAMQNPNLQNLPRTQKDENALANIVRNLIVAADGHTFYARDFSGIEAVLVGYFAMAPGYIRLAKSDVHSFYTAYALAEQGRFPKNDLPLLSWDDERLFKRLKEIKAEYGYDRNNLYKHLVHGANFMQGAKGAADTVLRMTGKEVSPSVIGHVMEIYFELFPEIRKWHKAVLAQVDKDGFIRNPFGYVQRFNKVYDWEYDERTREWQKTIGPDANKVIASGPQSTAAGIIKEAMMRIYQNHFDAAGRWLRLIIHDEIFMEVPDDRLHNVDVIVKAEMERPIPELRLPSAWGMGDFLVVNTEEKVGKVWGQMR